MKRPTPILQQTLIGFGVLIVGGAMGAGAALISSEAGYSGVGPNFLPWMVAVVMLICGGWIIWEARTGGFRNGDEPTGSEHGHWAGFAWVSAGLLSNAALITHAGFILSCALCFVLAVRGLRSAEGNGAGGVAQVVRDAATGLAISAPVYWMFTKLLAINLPGLTASGWL